MTEENLPTDSEFTRILSDYLLEMGPVFLLVYDFHGIIHHSNSHARETMGQDLRNQPIHKILFSLPEDQGYQGLLDNREHLLNVETFTGLPQTYFFRFFQIGEMILALGRLDLKEMERLRQKLIDLTDHINNMNRQLIKTNTELDMARQQLEAKVEDSTKQLTQSNIDLITENRERRRIQRSLKKSEKKLLILSTRILDAHERERKRIAGELHDSLAQILSAVQVWLGETEKDIGTDDRAALQSLESARKLSQEAIDEVQRISRNLRPAMLDNLGLCSAVQWHCDNIEKTHPQFCIKTRLDVAEEHIPEYLKIVIFRIVQEALQNMVKHSKASFSEVSLVLGKIKQHQTLSLSIRDNGQGFELRKVRLNQPATGGLGLDTMRERAELSKGFFSIQSRKGKGTFIRARWPL